MFFIVLSADELSLLFCYCFIVLYCYCYCFVLPGGQQKLPTTITTYSWRKRPSIPLPSARVFRKRQSQTMQRLIFQAPNASACCRPGPINVSILAYLPASDFSAPNSSAPDCLTSDFSGSTYLTFAPDFPAPKFSAVSSKKT